MHIVVTADENWGIGYKGNRLVSVPADLKSLRRMVAGKTVVLGSRAAACTPAVLLDMVKEVYILSANTSRENLQQALGAGVRANLKMTICRNLETLLQALSEKNTDEVFVLGGEQVYTQLLPYCDTVHVTKIEHDYTADAWFPNLDNLPEWQIEADSDEQTYFDLEYYFLMYKRKQ